MERGASFIAKSMFLLAGMVLWAVHFGVVYAVTALACARGLSRSQIAGVPLIGGSVVVLTVLAAAGALVVLALALAGRGPGIGNEPPGHLRHFWRFTTALTAGLGLVAIIWTGLPALMIPPCA